VQGKVHRLYSTVCLIIFAWLYLVEDKEKNILNMIGVVKGIHLLLTVIVVCFYLFIYGFYICSKRVKYFKTILCVIIVLIIASIVILDLTK
jgi:hypothetical protein